MVCPALFSDEDVKIDCISHHIVCPVLDVTPNSSFAKNFIPQKGQGPSVWLFVHSMFKLGYPFLKIVVYFISIDDVISSD